MGRKHLCIPNETCGMELHDVFTELLEEGGTSTSPLDMLDVLLLEFLDDTVPVELSTVLDGGDVWAGLRANTQPVECIDSLRGRVDMVGPLAVAVLVFDLNDLGIIRNKASKYNGVIRLLAGCGCKEDVAQTLVKPLDRKRLRRWRAVSDT